MIQIAKVTQRPNCQNVRSAKMQTITHMLIDAQLKNVKIEKTVVSAFSPFALRNRNVESASQGCKHIVLDSVFPACDFHKMEL